MEKNDKRCVGWALLVLLSRCCFLDSSGVPSFPHFKLETCKYSWKLRSLGTELEAATIPPSHDSSSMKPCPCHHLRKKVLKDKSKERGVWVYGKMTDLNCPLLLLTPSAVSWEHGRRYFLSFSPFTPYRMTQQCHHAQTSLKPTTLLSKRKKLFFQILLCTTAQECQGPEKDCIFSRGQKNTIFESPSQRESGGLEHSPMAAHHSAAHCCLTTTSE